MTRFSLTLARVLVNVAQGLPGDPSMNNPCVPHTIRVRQYREASVVFTLLVEVISNGFEDPIVNRLAFGASGVGGGHRHG